MKLILSIFLAVVLCSGAYALDVTKPTSRLYLVILPDGSDNQHGVTFVIKRITEQSYVGDILDSDGNCIAKHRRFFFVNAITDQLTEGEKGLVLGTEPDDKWDVETIRLWMDSMQAKDEDGIVLKDDPYSYDEKSDAAALLSQIADTSKME